MLTVVLGAAGAWVYFRLYPEPSYQGKAMSSWFKESCRSGQFMQGSYDWDRQSECVAAFKAMGTNAVPFLVEQAFDFRRESATWSNISRFLNHAPSSWPVPRPIPTWTKMAEATTLLKEIKPPAGQLLAQMQEHLNATNVDEHRQALNILGSSGEGAAQAVPYLTAALKEKDNLTRRHALASLRRIGPQAQAAAPDLIGMLREPSGTDYLGEGAASVLAVVGGPKAASAVPAIRELFEQETNWVWRGDLGVALMRIDPTQTEVLDFLIEGVTSHQPASQRSTAAIFLGRIGPAARPAAPVLIKALEQTNDTLFSAISWALTNIGVAKSDFLPQMKAQLMSSGLNTRVNAAARVLEVDPADRDARQVLMKSIEDGRPYKEVEVEALGNAGAAAADALPVLRKVARETTDAGTQRKALRAIKKIEGPPK